MQLHARPLGLGLALGVVIWVFEAAIHAAYVTPGPFVDQLLFDVSRQELYIRTVVIGLCVVFGAVISVRREPHAGATGADIGFGAAVNASGHAIYFTDADGTIEFVNPAFEVITGYPAADAIGRTPRILSSGEMSEAYFRDLWETVSSGETWDEVVINARRDGTEYHAHQTIAPISVGGDLQGYVAIQTDITESEDLKYRLDTIISHLPGIVYRCRIERGWPMEYVGGDVPGLVGYPADAIESGEVSWGRDVIHPDDREEVWRELQAELAADEPITLVYRILTAADETKWICMYGRATTLRADEGAVLDGLVMDVTREHDLESELENTIQQLQVLDRVLRHNLHNDMNVVMGYAELIAEGSTGRARRDAELILRRSEQLLAMVDKERGISKTLAENPALMPVDVDSLLTEVVARCREAFPAARISYTNDGVQSMLAINGTHLALSELVENAVKHAEADHPRVRIVVTDRGTGVRIDVIDDGPPLPDMERNIIFEGDEVTPLNHGSGLGLWLVTVVVNSAGGAFTHAYRDPRGNVFSIDLAAGDRA